MTAGIAITGSVVAAVAVIAVLAGGWLRHRLLVVTVSGTSMLPTLRPGDRVLIRRVPIKRLRPGQIVVTRPGRPVLTLTRQDPLLMIKRVAAVPGDPVPRVDVPALAGVPESAVPSGRFVVLGDNPDGTDSRELGYFYAEYLLGVVIRTLPGPANAVR